MNILVSVNSGKEAKLADQAGASWIDLKDPTAGPLGAATPETQQLVLDALQSSPAKRSLACGDLAQWLLLPCPPAPLAGFHFAKMGLSHLTSIACSRQEPDGWRSVWYRWAGFLPAGCQPVVVSYADWETCGGLALDEAIQFAATGASPYVLIDTFFKNGKGLFSCLERSTLFSHQASVRDPDLPASGWNRIPYQVVAALKHAARKGVQLVWAGQLDFAQARQLGAWGAEITGFRSAICDGSRSGTISPEKLRHALTLENRTNTPRQAT